MKYPHGLVIGKFYPPHRGHHALIRAAVAGADRVTVIAMSSATETLPLADRVRWLRAEHTGEPVDVRGVLCDAPVDFDSPAVWAAQVACMRAVCPDPVDAVFTGEDYGTELARRFGAVHVRVDRSRMPVSGTAIRADPAGCWDDLATATRAGLATRIVVHGAESTGSTTVSRALADRFRARGGIWARTGWVREYGRDVSTAKVETAGTRHLRWTGPEFAAIARRQTALADAAASSGSPLLVCDTDAFTTTVWERRYLGPASRWAVAPTSARTVYLVTDHVGVPFVQDGVRDGEHLRAEMTSWFVDASTAAGRSWVLLTGSLAERVDLAERVADRTLAVGMRFADP